MEDVYAKKVSRNWCFTSFDCSKTFDVSDHIKYIVWQREKCPRTGHLHLQGYVEFRKPCRFRQAKTWLGDPRIHIESRRGSRNDAILYCKKNETRDKTGGDAGPWEKGTKSKSNNQAKKVLEKVVHDIKQGATFDEIVEEYPVAYIQYTKGMEAYFFQHSKKQSKKWREVRVEVYWGATGIGKTRKAITLYPDCYILNNSNGNQVWFNGYSNEKVLVIDEFYGWIQYSTLLRMLDGYQFRGDSKFGFKYGYWDKVIITTNRDPDLWYKNKFNHITAPLLRRIDHIWRMNWYDEEKTAVTITDVKDWYLPESERIKKDKMEKQLEFDKFMELDDDLRLNELFCTE